MAGNKQKQVPRNSSNNNNNNNNNNNTNNNSLMLGQSSSSSSSSTLSSTSTPSCPIECFNCHKPIRERFLLKALDQYWHEDCLKCSCCDCRLGEVGSTLFTKANLILCKRDYLRLFGNTGFCSACNKTIPGFEMVMRAKSNVYHLECFSCFQCHEKFCVGDRFYLYENKILCEYDFEERMVFANLSRNNMDLMRHPSTQSAQHAPGVSAALAPPQPQPPVQHHPGIPHHLSNNMNNTNNQHHSKMIMMDNNNGQEMCDASSGYASGDSPFDH